MVKIWSGFFSTLGQHSSYPSFLEGVLQLQLAYMSDCYRHSCMIHSLVELLAWQTLHPRLSSLVLISRISSLLQCWPLDFGRFGGGFRDCNLVAEKELFAPSTSSVSVSASHRSSPPESNLGSSPSSSWSLFPYFWRFNSGGHWSPDFFLVVGGWYLSLLPRLVFGKSLLCNSSMVYWSSFLTSKVGHVCLVHKVHVAISPVLRQYHQHWHHPWQWLVVGISSRNCSIQTTRSFDEGN